MIVKHVDEDSVDGRQGKDAITRLNMKISKKANENYELKLKLGEMSCEIQRLRLICEDLKRDKQELIIDQLTIFDQMEMEPEEDKLAGA